MSPEMPVRPIGPVRPEEAEALCTEQIPETVFEVFNGLIAQNLQRGEATVLQDDVLEQLQERGFNRAEVFRQKWLDVEESYREAGWQVKYDRPVYWGGENFKAYFQFSTEDNRRRRR